MSLFDRSWIIENSFVRRVERHEELASTNSRALELAADEGLPTPLLVLCERQTEGRGRGANQWWSAEGSLTFSLLLEPAQWNLPAERFPRVSLMAGVAVCEAVQAMLPANTVGLKWPNDVHVDGLKACGILVELPPRSRRLVVGIGLNVNTSFEAAPDEVCARATSLANASGVELALGDVLDCLLQQIEANLKLLAEDEAAMAAKWHVLSVLTGRRVELDVGQRRVVGMCRRIDGEGALVLQTAAGEERFFAGVVAKW